jgi:hypothetical protein
MVRFGVRPTQLPSLKPQSLQGLPVPLLLSTKTASAATIKQTVRIEMITATNTKVLGEKIPLRIWLRISNKPVTQRKHNKKIIALPKRYGTTALKVSIVTQDYHP